MSWSSLQQAQHLMSINAMPYCGKHRFHRSSNVRPTHKQMSTLDLLNFFKNFRENDPAFSSFFEFDQRWKTVCIKAVIVLWSALRSESLSMNLEVLYFANAGEPTK